MAKFFEMLETRWNAGARGCVGLDSDWKKVPNFLTYMQGAYPDVGKFNRKIIEATADLALCYKLNIAFYCGDYHKEAQETLQRSIRYIRELAPSVPIILDSKRGDIANTNIGYVDEAFGYFDADALTVSPYFGMEAMKPFLDQKDKGIIVLCRTSNPGAGEFQDLVVSYQSRPGSLVRDMLPLYQVVAHRVASEWNYNGNCALVVGATAPEQLGQVRKIVGDDVWILIPGIGKQGGDLEKSVQNGINQHGRGIIINSSSGIIFASGGVNFADASRLELKKLTDGINAALPKPGQLVDKTF